MKTTKYIIGILLLSMAIISCRKKIPEPDTIGFGIPSKYTNKYILTNINTKITPDIDTVNYNDFYINVNLSGYMISENVAFTDVINTNTNPYIPNPIEQKYFINKISNIEVTTNISYNDSLLYNDNLFIPKYLNFYSYDKKRQLIERNNFYGEELGYTPLMIKINIPPDTSKWVSFTVKITDDKDNVFTSTTDEIFITK